MDQERWTERDGPRETDRGRRNKGRWTERDGQREMGSVSLILSPLSLCPSASVHLPLSISLCPSPSVHLCQSISLSPPPLVHLPLSVSFSPSLLDRLREMDRERRTEGDRPRETDKGRWTKGDGARSYVNGGLGAGLFAVICTKQWSSFKYPCWTPGCKDSNTAAYCKRNAVKANCDPAKNRLAHVSIHLTISISKCMWMCMPVQMSIYTYTSARSWFALTQCTLTCTNKWPSFKYGCDARPIPPSGPTARGVAWRHAILSST